MRFRSGHQSLPSEPGARRLPRDVRRTLPRIPGRRVPGVRVGTSAPGQYPPKPTLPCATDRKRPVGPGTAAARGDATFPAGTPSRRPPSEDGCRRSFAPTWPGANAVARLTTEPETDLHRGKRFRRTMSVRRLSRSDDRALQRRPRPGFRYHHPARPPRGPLRAARHTAKRSPDAAGIAPTRRYWHAHVPPRGLGGQSSNRTPTQFSV